MPEIPDSPERPRGSSPVAAVASVLKHDPLMQQTQAGKKSKKRPHPWELSDSESEGARKRKKQRVGEKQVRYAYVAHKFPKQSKARKAEDAIAWYESATDGREPLRRKQKWQRDQLRPSRLDLTDLEYVKALGVGSYGRVGVVRVRKRQYAHPLDFEGCEMAVKSVLKRKVREEGPEHPTWFTDRFWDVKNVERGNLQWLPWDPFFAGMYDCLADSRNLYTLQELGSLGTLAAYIEKHAPLRPSVSQFYFSNIVVALEHLAALKLAHGDLKPANILIGSNGYLMLADFGISSRWDEMQRMEICTMAYGSPEITRCEESSAVKQALDWWGAACILYEMATGKMVFANPHPDPEQFLTEDDETDDVFMRVLAAHYCWPNAIAVDPLLKSLVDDMLVWDLEKRLGAKCKRLESGKVVNVDIRCHAWYDGYCWADIENRTYLAPYLPTERTPSAETWHERPMPPQAETPGLPQVQPPRHLEHDTRSRRWRLPFISDEAQRAKVRAALQAKFAKHTEEYKRHQETEAANDDAAQDVNTVRDQGSTQDPVPGASEQPPMPQGEPAATSTRTDTSDGANAKADSQAKQEGRGTKRRDPNELETVPTNSIPRSLKAGSLPLFRAPNVKPKVTAPGSLPSSPAPEETELVQEFNAVPVTVRELLEYGAAQGWTVRRLAMKVLKWKYAIEGKDGPPTKEEILWEQERLRVANLQCGKSRVNSILQETHLWPDEEVADIIQARSEKEKSGKSANPGSQKVQQNVQSTSSFTSEELARFGPRLDQMLLAAKTWGWTLRETLQRYGRNMGHSEDMINESLDVMEGLLQEYKEIRESEGKLKAVQPTAGTSTGTPLQASSSSQPPVLPPAGPAAQPGAPRRPAPLSRQPSMLNVLGSPESSPPAAGPSNAPPASLTLPRPPLLGVMQRAMSQPEECTAQPEQRARAEAQLPLAPSMAAASVGHGMPPQQAGVRYHPYPARIPDGTTAKVRGAGAPPAAAVGRPRMHGPDGHVVSQAGRGQAVVRGSKTGQRAEQSQDVQQGQERAGSSTAGSTAALGARVQPSLLGPLPPPPRTPPGQIFKLGSRPYVSPPSGAGPVTVASRPSRTGGASAAGQGARRSRSPTRAGAAPPPSSSSAADNTGGMRRISSGDDLLPLGSLVLRGGSPGERDRTPTRSRAPRASGSSAGPHNPPLVWSPPLSPAGTVVGSPTGLGSPTGTVIGSPPRWSP